jgi:site-specific recombinase XerD
VLFQLSYIPKGKWRLAGMAASSVDLPTSFKRHLRAENKSVRTVETYLEAVQQLDSFLRSRGLDLAAADRDDIEAYLTGLLARWKPATAAKPLPRPAGVLHLAGGRG